MQAGRQIWRFALCAIALSVLSALSACGGRTDGQAGSDGSNGLTTLAAVALEPPGSHCSAGGSKISAGLDANGNGVLDSAEVSSTQYVCNGASGVNGLTELSLLAGDIGASGFIDGPALAARFDHPQGVAVDCAGNLYVADARNHVIRKITAAGAVSTLANPASDCGFAGLPAPCLPGAVAVDAAGALYVTDNSTFIRKITPDGMVTTFAVLPAPQCNPVPLPPLQPVPCPERIATGIAVDAAGFVYVALSSDNLILKISPAGDATTFAGAPLSNAIDGPGDQARFFSLGGLALDGAGNLFVADTFNNAIRRITPAGQVTTLAGGGPAAAGYLDATGAAARFNLPDTLSIDAAGNLYVNDANGSAVRKVTPGGVVTTVAYTDSFTANTGQPAPSGALHVVTLQYTTFVANSAGVLYFPSGCAIEKSGP